MIRSKHGKTQISGTTVEVFADFTTIIRTMKNALVEEMGEEDLRKKILNAVDDGLLSEEDLSKKIADKIGISPETLDKLADTIASLANESAEKADEVLRILGVSEEEAKKWS